MSQLADPVTTSDHSPDSPCPDPDAVLVPKLDERFALTRTHMILIGIGCLFFMYYNYTRLFHSDFWGHVAYGNWMLDHGQLPTQELFVKWAAGVPLVCTAWLSQVLLGAISRSGDVEWFSHLFAVTMLATYVTYAVTFFHQTRSWPTAVVCCVLAWIVVFSRHSIIRPEIFGGLCFAALALLLVLSDTARTRERSESAAPMRRGQAIRHWAGVFVLFVLWANLHGSFIVGYALLGSYLVGRAVEVLWSKQDMQDVFRDRLFQQRLIACELAVAGSLLNPYGFDLLIHTLVFPSNPNLTDVWEWYPLEMVSLEGPFMLFSWALLLVTFRHSRVRISASDVVLLSVFTLATCLRVRMIQWYGPSLLLVLAPHLQDILARLIPWAKDNDLGDTIAWLETRSFRHTLITALMIWVAFCFSPASRPLLGGKPREARHVYSADTPRELTEFLRRHPPRGAIANPQWWGDWLAYDGPEGLQVLMTTNAVHVVPPRVWKDYLAIAEGEDGLLNRLDHYRINTIVISKSLQGRLEREARNLSGWTIVYNDDIGMVVTRDAGMVASVEAELAAGEAASESDGQNGQGSGNHHAGDADVSVDAPADNGSPEVNAGVIAETSGRESDTELSGTPPPSGSDRPNP